MFEEKNRTRILVTGANSLLGTNVILELLGRGYLVRGFLRDRKKFKPRGLNIELIEGDITNKKELTGALEGCEAAIHTAAVTSPGLSPEIYKRVNINGTLNFTESAKICGLKRIVFVSTANTIGYGNADHPGDETAPPKKPFTGLPYADSKIRAEKIVLSAAAEASPEAVIVNPTFMIGAWDSKPGSGQIITLAWGKKIIFVPPGGKNFIPVADASAGVCNALEKGENGQRYLLAGVNMKYIEFFRLLRKVSNSRSRLVKLPAPFMLAAGFFGSLFYSAGIRTRVTLTTMKILCTYNYYASGKAVDKLDLPLSPLENAIREAVEWFNKEGMLK